VQLAAGTNRLDRAEDLFDDLATVLTPRVARRSGRSPVDRGAPALFVLSDPRSSWGQVLGRHPQRAQVPDEVARAVGPFRAQIGPTP